MSDDSETENSPIADAAEIEAGPEYDITRLLHLARLLTSDNAFLTSDSASAETLLDLAQAPSCDADSGPYVELLTAMSSDPPTYEGEDPIADITMTLRQLASCERSTERSLLSKIGDFFTHRDGGKTLRQILLLSKVIIQCLALWFVMKQNNLLEVESMQHFCKAALVAHGVSHVEASDYPESIATMINESMNWQGDMTTVVSTFRIGKEYPAPVLLVFNEAALASVVEETEKGSLPNQVEEEAEATQEQTGSDDTVVPLTFIPRTVLNKVVRDFISSGNVKPAPGSEQ